MWKENKPRREYMEVGIGYWEKFIKSLKDFAGNDLYIHFVGGESLTNDAILPLIKYASILGCGTVLTSNGYLINEDMAKKIADCGLKEIWLSLDGLKADTHDFLRGVKGSFQRVNTAIEYLNKHAKNVRIRINTVMTEINLEEIIGLATRVIENPSIESINFLAVSQPFDTKPEEHWYENNNYNFLWPKAPEKAERIIDILIKLKEKNASKILNSALQFKAYKLYFRNPQDCFRQTGCFIYKRLFHVSQNGQISICFHMDPLGNIKQDEFDMEEIWNSSLAEQVKDKIRNCGKNCHLRVNSYFD
jgi:MoaA/NifB/PqqE/SkfB family radical SAM enzyme